MNKTAIIVAGGSGHRMGINTPKQFLLLNDLPILMHTIKAFYKTDKSINIILALPEDNFHYWEELCAEYNFDIPHSLSKGGKTRYHTVKNALSLIEEEAIIAIHDGVRPLVSNKCINNCFNTANELGNAVPVIDLVDSIRKVVNENNKSVVRSNYKLVQTPQVFNSKILIDAYKQEYKNSFTDDASVVENLGYKINLVEGNKENIKITTKTDLLIANALINKI